MGAPPGVVVAAPVAAAAAAAACRAAASLAVMISWALWLSTLRPYLVCSGDTAATCASSASVRGAILESGGTRRVAASGVGMPFVERTVTSASPMPSEVIVRSTS